MQPAVFLDRDNTLIANDGDLGDPGQVRLLDGVVQGLAALREAGFRLVVITNQGGVARGRYGEADVDAVHQEIASQVDLEGGRTGIIERFYYCPYHPDGTVPEYRRDHPWRKPRPGMILQAADDMGLDLRRSWVIGDQPRDIEAGRRAGCQTVLVGGTAEDIEAAPPTAAVGTFAEAVGAILREHRPTQSEEEPGQEQGQLRELKQVISDLADELRMERARRAAFTPMKLTAFVCQLIGVLLLLMGLLYLGEVEVFMTWAVGAIFMQLVTIAFLLADSRA